MGYAPTSGYFFISNSYTPSVLYYTSIVELLTLISPKEIFSTMFGVNQSLKKLARVFGTMLGDYIYKRYGGTVLFVGVGIMCCSWT